MMNLSQTKLVGLTMELDLKTREYKKICDKLDKLKEKNIDDNDETLLNIKELFQKNHDDIAKINREIKQIKEKEEIKEKQKIEQYNLENIFNKENNKVKEEENMKISVIKNKENIFIGFIKRLKKFFI